MIQSIVYDTASPLLLSRRGADGHEYLAKELMKNKVDAGLLRLNVYNRPSANMFDYRLEYKQFTVIV